MFEVCIDVDDVAKAIRFYGEGIGLRLVKSDQGWAQMADGETVFWIMESPWGSWASTESKIPRAYDRHWTPVHLDFVVADLDAAVGRAIAAGGKLEGQVQKRPDGGLANLVDPAGNGLDLVQRSDKK
jgi:predicted enzyme related to lactoylglutathione lyase